MSTTLNKITARAKVIRKKHPSLKYTDAVKKASIELRKEGKIGGVKTKKVAKKVTAKKRKINKIPLKKSRSKKLYQTGSSKKSSDIKRKAKPPGKRKSASGKTYFERRKNRSDMPHMLSGISKKDQKEGFEKVQRFHKYAHLMSDNYNKQTTAGSNAGFEYQRKCFNLLNDIPKYKLDAYAKKIFDAAYGHYKYFKK